MHLLTDLAKTTAGEDGPFELHIRRARSWYGKGFLKPCAYRGEGKTAAAEFDDETLALFSSMIALTDDANFGDRQLAQFLQGLSPVNFQPTPNKIEKTGLMSKAIASVKAGKKSLLLVNLPDKPNYAANVRLVEAGMLKPDAFAHATTTVVLNLSKIWVQP